MTPLQRYRRDLQRQGFCADNAQRDCVRVLQTLYEGLTGPRRLAAAWRFLSGGEKRQRGVYLYGGPGRGKTYLMDCFYECLPFAEKRRLHFHRFMLEVHQTLDALPQMRDPLKRVAAQLSGRRRVLCLDEFHVTDTADAMLLAGLLEHLFRRGTVLVATSNDAPQSLYRDGLQRDRFLPAIGLLERRTQLVCLDGGADYRQGKPADNGTYRVVATDAEAEHWLRERMQLLAPGERIAEDALEIAGRCLQLRACAQKLVWFDFAQLCESARSTGDYLQLAQRFPIILLQGVPQMGDEQDEAVRRFIHLVDALYDHAVTLIVTAAAEPARLYQGVRLREAFRRTASRLTEMSSQAYPASLWRTDHER